MNFLYSDDGTMYFRDHLACGHSMLVEVLVPIDPVVRCRRDVGLYSLCVHCPRREGGSMALSEIVSTDHMLGPGVWADADAALHLDLVVMCESAGFEPTDANQATLAEAARQVFDTPIEVVNRGS